MATNLTFDNCFVQILDLNETRLEATQKRKVKMNGEVDDDHCFKEKRAKLEEPMDDDPCQANQDQARNVWDPDDNNNYFEHSGGVYQTFLLIPMICRVIIDTPAFQRMDRIRQLGCCHFVYRQATYTRFEHSLGVADLARRVMDHLRRHYKGLIDGNDELCVIIAGLCHDMGHGPFSHTFELFVKEHRGKKFHFRHEEKSIEVFKYILNHEKNVKKWLSKYLDEKDFQFICELIDPPAFFDEEGNWNMKGRSQDKSFLYEIISNRYSGLDVDKLDYILRDSSHNVVATGVNAASIDYLIRGIRAEPYNNLRRLVCKEKLSPLMENVFLARQQLFQNVYYHKNVFPVEYELIKAFCLASKHLQVPGKDGKLITLDDCIENIEGYLSLTDDVLTVIKWSQDQHPDMIEARKCIENMERRQLHTPVAIIRRINDVDEDEVDNAVERYLAKNPDLKGKVLVKCRHYHFGLGLNRDPTTKILYDSSESKPSPKNNSPLSTYSSIFFYGKHGTTRKEAEAIYRLATTINAENHGDLARVFKVQNNPRF
uniref:HD domain-containing protein n=1 Tax=Panagrolaimus sp. JU765 TaxID=591449 RepID=A0AC34QR89_9BILA